MESSRGGPLTTFIMMLPLIVVPSIAMLKPAGEDGSILSGLLSAASSKDESQADELAGDGFSEFSEFLESDPVAELSESAETGFSELDQLFSEASGMSLDDSAGTANASAPAATNAAWGGNFPSNSGDTQTESLMRELDQLGTTRTLWFSPGREMFGFVAFFKAGNGIMSYRFESIAATRAAAVQDVVLQARNWQAGSRQ